MSHNQQNSNEPEFKISQALAPLAAEINKIPGLTVIFASGFDWLHFKAELTQRGAKGVADVVEAFSELRGNLFDTDDPDADKEDLPAIRLENDTYPDEFPNGIPDALHFDILRLGAAERDELITLLQKQRLRRLGELN